MAPAPIPAHKAPLAPAEKHIGLSEAKTTGTGKVILVVVIVVILIAAALLYFDMKAAKKV